MQIKEAMNFPVISRTGRTSAELQAIIDTLILSSQNGKPYSIEGIQPGKKYNSMQQRIRAQAKKLDLNVNIHFDKMNQTLFFRVQNSSELETTTAPKKEVVKAKDVRNVRSAVKSK